MRSNSEESHNVNKEQTIFQHYTDLVQQQSEEPVAGPSNSSTASALSHPQTHGGGSNDQPAIPQFFQEMGYGSWRDRVTEAIRKVLDRLGSVNGITSMTDEVRTAIGEEGFDDLAQHLVDTESDLTVAGFVHRCLWHGVACGLWRQVGETWRRLEL